MLISDKTICEFTGLDCKRKYECKYLEHRFGATRCDDPEYLQACMDTVHEQELEERANNPAVWSERKEELIK